MKKRTKQMILTLGSALGSAVLGVLVSKELHEDAHESQPKPTSKATTPALSKQSGLRGIVVDLFSDVLAETYRKIRSERTEKR